MKIEVNNRCSVSEGRLSYMMVSKKTGKPVGFPMTTHNVVAYNAADIMARLISGNVNYIPSKIGFIYAPSAASIADPGTDRDQPWATIAQDVETINGNMVISNLAATPIISEDGPDGRYTGNAATLNAVSDAAAGPVFSGGGYEATGPQAGSDKYFQVVLMAAVYGPGQTVPTYIPYARAALASGIDVAADTELAVYWTQTFK